MGFVSTWLIVALSVHVCTGIDYDAEVCPDPKSIAPCMCDGEGMSCMNMKSDAELENVINNLKASKTKWYFRGTWIQGNDITRIRANMFEGMESSEYHLEANLISIFEAGAFAGSEETIATISLFGNLLISFPFPYLRKCTYLNSINLGRNRLTTIPDNAFSNNKYLSQVILAENLIGHIGPNAFQGLPSLQRLEISHNRLTTLGPLSLSMSGHHPALSISLVNNTIGSVSPTTFTGTTPKMLLLPLNQLQYLDENAFFPLVQRMAKLPGLIDVTLNPFSCKGCMFRWIVVNKNSMQYLLPGFRCITGETIAQLTTWSIGCV